MKKNLDITKPRSSEQILAVPWLFVMSRAHCTNWGHSFYVSYWSWDQARRTRHSPRLARKAPIMQATITWAGPARIHHFYIEIGNNPHEQCVTCCPVSRLAYSPGRPASVITWKISARDPGITILGSQLTGLARLSYNRKVDFCCVSLRCRDLCSCNQAVSFIARFYFLPLDLTDFSKHQRMHTKFQPPLNIFTSPSLY